MMMFGSSKILFTCLVAVASSSCVSASLRGRTPTTAQHRSLAQEVIVDFSGFEKGDRLSNLGNGVSVVAWKRQGSKSGPLVPATAMIFDTSSPTGDDPDLGTPNEDFGGPGKGKAGKEGKPTENRFFQGNVVIISEDDDSSDPDDHGKGGTLLFTFDVPVDLKEVGLLDNEEGTIFTAQLASGATVQKIAGQGGDNSYEPILFDGSSPVGALDRVVQLNITMGGSGAITHIYSEESAPTAAPTTLVFDSTAAPTTLEPTTAPTPAPTTDYRTHHQAHYRAHHRTHH